MAEIVTVRLPRRVDDIGVTDPDGGIGPGRSIDEIQAEFEARYERKFARAEKHLARQETALQQTARAMSAIPGQLEQWQQQLLTDMEQQAVALAMEIAEKVVHQELDAGRVNIDAIVREAMAQLPRADSAVVHLNPADLERSGLANNSGDSDSVQFQADATVPPGGCVVRSAEGRVESTPDESLQQIRRTFTEGQ